MTGLRPRSRWKATLMVALAASSWGCWSLFLRPTNLSPLITSTWVFAVMGLALLPFSRVDGVIPTWDRVTFVLLLLNATLDAVNVMAFFGAMAVTTVGVAVLSHYLAPLLVALLAPFIDREHIAGARWAALAALLGLTLVFRPWDGTPSGHGMHLGAGLGALSALCYASNVFIIKRLSGRIGAARAVAWHSLLAALLIAPFSLRAGWGRVAAVDARLLTAGSILLGGLAGWLFVKGLRVIGSTRATTLAYLEPLVAVVVAYFAWGEHLAPTALGGGALILGAGAWVSRRPAVERAPGLQATTPS